ncbi:hypothetical protein K488DRAFT_72215 [Vararia minispora EC-137]|uniref:Uncharacterized protein n=1 Tax=Vararia minispora EC-137 TaxID=1314806 RepID=A0ACB8QFR5_9AGAM|nr:hypothetical protein K488DRAFT_72215 [Vararia minispora EC-137]
MGDTGYVGLWDARMGRALRECSDVEGSVSVIAVSPDGHTIAYAVDGGRAGTSAVYMWDIGSAALPMERARQEAAVSPRRLDAYDAHVVRLRFSLAGADGDANASYLTATLDNGRVIAWMLSPGGPREPAHLSADQEEVLRTSFDLGAGGTWDPDGKAPANGVFRSVSAARA